MQSHVPYPSQLFYQRQLIAVLQKLVILVKASFWNAHLQRMILSDCTDNEDFPSPPVLVLNVKKYICPFLFQQDLLPLTSSVGPPKVVPYH